MKTFKTINIVLDTGTKQTGYAISFEGNIIDSGHFKIDRIPLTKQDRKEQKTLARIKRINQTKGRAMVLSNLLTSKLNELVKNGKLARVENEEERKKELIIINYFIESSSSGTSRNAVNTNKIEFDGMIKWIYDIDETNLINVSTWRKWVFDNYDFKELNTLFPDNWNRNSYWLFTGTEWKQIAKFFTKTKNDNQADAILMLEYVLDLSLKEEHERDYQANNPI